MARDLHKNPFNEETKIKLSLFKEYLDEWVPVFICAKKPKWKTINIFDFFAGPGYDSVNTEGSPIIILNKIKKCSNYIKENDLTVNIVLNEKDDKKFNELVSTCEAYKNLPINIILRNTKFSEAFLEFQPLMANAANLLFLDQNGIKEITKEIFLSIVKLQTTDFLFFISSSYLRRFFQMPVMSKYLNIKAGEIENSKYSDIHRIVCQSYKNFIPDNKDYFLTQFTIKKGSNIYGLIFGTNHLLGIEKFLKVCWKSDPIRGEANFDIDHDRIDLNSPSLFPEMNKSNKLRQFEKELEYKIINKEITTNKDVILFSLSNGFLKSHANNLIKNLIENKIIPKQSLKLSQPVHKANFEIIDIILN